MIPNFETFDKEDWDEIEAKIYDLIGLLEEKIETLLPQAAQNPFTTPPIILRQHRTTVSNLKLLDVTMKPFTGMIHEFYSTV